LSKVFGERLQDLERIVKVKPDELAPSLGTVILALAEGIVGEGELPYYKPSIFFSLTHPTENFIKVLKSIVESLKSGGTTALFLNLDMGSGKTHLETLMLHLFVSCNIAPQQCHGYLEDYKGKAGYSEDLARRTVVFAFDLRTPKLAYRYLRLTEKTLEAAGLPGVADIVRQARENGRMPDPQRLAGMLPEDVNILILVDELHYVAVIGDDEDRRITAEVVKFILDLVNYRRALRRAPAGGIAVLVASARRDFYRWQEVRSAIPDRGFAAVLDSFVDQLQRIESSVETRWLSLGEAKGILERRLGLGRGAFDSVFHSSFDRFVERVIRADTDIPQAHHMRSLIKVMALYALNATRAGDSIVTPARFDENVVDMLLAGSDIAMGYKTIYGEIVERLRGSGDDDKVLLAVNTIFSLTLTGAPEKLVEMIRIEKSGEVVGHLHIPVVREVELRAVLRAHGLTDSAIDSVVSILDRIHPNMHRVSLVEGGHAYFIAPVASVLAIYRALIDERYKSYLSNPQALLEHLKDYVQSLAYNDEYSEQELVESLQVLEKRSRFKDRFYVYIYTNWSLLFELKGLETREDSYDVMVRDVNAFLEGKREHNIAFVLLKVKQEVLEGLARYVAVEEATQYIISQYIAPLERPAGRREDEIFRQLLEIELGDLKAEVVRQLNEALASLTGSMKFLLEEVRYYTPKGILWERLGLKEEDVERLSIQDVRKAVDMLRERRQHAIGDIAKALNQRVRQGLVVLVTAGSSYFEDILYRDVIESLKRQGVASIWFKEPRLEKLEGPKDRWAYVPPRVVKSMAVRILERVKEDFGKDYDVQLNMDDERCIILMKPKPQQQIQITIVKPSQPTGAEAQITQRHEGLLDSLEFMKLIDSVKDRGGELIVSVRVKVDKESADPIRRALGQIKRYILGGRIEKQG
jgi:predicted kinase